MSKRVVIVGGGVVGLATAWHVIQRGHEVTVVDRQASVRDGCSFGNAGMLVPSHVVPLAAPGMIRTGLRYLMRRDSPLAIHLRPSWELLRWLWYFRSACTRKHVDLAAPLLQQLHMRSREAFIRYQSDVDDFGLKTSGIMMLCRTESMFREEVHGAWLAKQLGMKAETLGGREIAKLDPNADYDVLGGVYYPQDCRLDPQRLMLSLQDQLEHAGCQFLWETSCQGFRQQADSIVALETDGGPIEADEFILCGGVWTSNLASQLGLSMPMQSGKGYSITLQDPPQLPSIASILMEARVAVTPIGDSLRFAGTMEIGASDQRINAHRVEGIRRSIPNYFPRLKTEDFVDRPVWAGLRPCSPDGLPYLGRTERCKNLTISAGHAMMGISLAMVSGQIVSDLIDRSPTGIDQFQLLSPDRYAGKANQSEMLK